MSGKQWGSLDGTLAVAALKASEMLFIRFDADGAPGLGDAARAAGPSRPAALGHRGDATATCSSPPTTATADRVLQGLATLICPGLSPQPGLRGFEAAPTAEWK